MIKLQSLNSTLIKFLKKAFYAEASADVQIVSKPFSQLSPREKQAVAYLNLGWSGSMLRSTFQVIQDNSIENMYFLAYYGDKIVGAASITNGDKNGSRNWLNVYVDPDYRRLDIGSRIVNYARKALKGTQFENFRSYFDPRRKSYNKKMQKHNNTAVFNVIHCDESKESEGRLLYLLRQELSKVKIYPKFSGMHQFSVLASSANTVEQIASRLGITLELVDTAESLQPVAL